MSASNTFHQNANDIASEAIAAPSIELSLSRFEKPIEVDLEKFFEFSFDLAEELLDLETRFKTGRSFRSGRSKRASFTPQSRRPY